MPFSELLHLAFASVIANRLRSVLTGLGIAIGIAAVILLTAIGQGLHQFVLNEFSQFGSNIIAIQPGKQQTHGGSVGIFGSSRPLTIQDAEALRQISGVQYVNASVQGNAELRGDGKTRRSTVYGVSADFIHAFTLKIQQGRFLPNDNAEQPRAFVVIGSKIRQELFSNQNPLGQYLRIGGQKYRIIGMMAHKGQVLGMDFDDAVFIPATRSLELFNRAGLMEIQVTFHPHLSSKQIEKQIQQILSKRHGREDFTLIPQEQALAVLNSVLNMLTFAVAALGAISLVVGAVGILTIMTMSVNERTTEIGLLRALGAEQHQILWLFLSEATLLSLLGGSIGLLFGLGSATILHIIFPALPIDIPWIFVLLALISTTFIGLVSGVIPAIRAAKLDPVEALRAE